MKYVIAIHKDENSDYGVTVPDLPGCFSAGSSLEEAMENAVEAIECHIEGMLIDGEVLPMPKHIEVHQHLKELRGAVWALVDIDFSKLSGKARRINITMPEHILHQVDDYAATHGESRSGLIANAALRYLAEA